MSHFVTIRTQLREREHLLQALRDLGFSFKEEEGSKVRGDATREEQAEIVADAGGGYGIGFRLKEGEYEVVADWYSIQSATSLRRERFFQQLKQRYAYHVIRNQAKEQNLIVEEEKLEDGNIVLVLSERG
jgi:hypothetical protein